MKRALGMLCALLLCGILIFGLWPFHQPRNAVAWLDGRDGIRLGELGTLWSSSPIHGVSDDPSCSLELWVAPASLESDTILSVAAPGNPKQFVLRQSHVDLVFGSSGRGRLRFEVDDLFEPGKPLFLVATAGPGGTAVYVDGKLAKSSADPRFSFRDLEGTLILSGLATNHDAWPGEIRAIAIYNDELSPAQVARHFESWTERGNPGVEPEEHPVAIYRFNERAGQVVYNQVSGEASLFIPTRYRVLEQVVLESPFTEFRPAWSYWEDVMVNVLGFIPFGFFFCAYFSWGHDSRWAAVATIFLGAITSLAIELLQSRIPTRDSSTTDVITNITGTCIGVAFLAGARFIFTNYPNSVRLLTTCCPIEFKKEH